MDKQLATGEYNDKNCWIQETWKKFTIQFWEQFLGIFCVPFDKAEGYCFILYILYRREYL